MRGHGYTVAASSIEECVFRAIYTMENAAVQTSSILLSGAARGAARETVSIDYLEENEVADATQISVAGWGRAWASWAREVKFTALYASVD